MSTLLSLFGGLTVGQFGAGSSSVSYTMSAGQNALTQSANVYVASTGLPNGTAPQVSSITDTGGNLWGQLVAINASRTAAGGPQPFRIELWHADVVFTSATVLTVTMTTVCNPGQDNGPWAAVQMGGAYTTTVGKTLSLGTYGGGTTWTSGANYYDTVPTSSAFYIDGVASGGALFNLNNAGSGGYAPGGSGAGESVSVLSSQGTLRTGVSVADFNGVFGYVGQTAGWTQGIPQAGPSSPVMALAATLVEKSPTPPGSQGPLWFVLGA